MIFYERRVRRMELFSYSLRSSVHTIDDRGKILMCPKTPVAFRWATRGQSTGK